MKYFSSPKICFVAYILTLCALFNFLNPTLLFAQSGTFGEDTDIGPHTTVSTDNYTSVGSTLAINAALVNIRSGPGTNFSILKTLPRGTTGKVLEEKNGWYRLDFGNGLKGWVRGDLVSSRVNSPPSQVDNSALAKEFSRWERHLGKTLLDYQKFPSYWRLGRAWRAFQNGDYQEAYDLAQSSNSNPIETRYLMAKALWKLGQTGEAKKLLDSIRRALEDAAMLQILDSKAKPYIDEQVVFKFGGFDDLKTYIAKRERGNRLGLNSSEYYEEFVDIQTWQWKSPAKYKEFQEIAGLDCSGYVQRVQRDLFAAAGVPFPIPGRTSTSGLWSGKYTIPINPGFRPPPPPDIRPGDMILLDYGHNRYGHSMIYRGIDDKGNILVTQMGETAEFAILSPEKFQYYKGTYRMKGMDQVRQRLLA